MAPRTARPTSRNRGDDCPMRCLLDHADAMNLIVDALRRDALGNLTVPSMVFETTARRVCKAFRDASKEVGTPFDGQLVGYTVTGGVKISSPTDPNSWERSGSSPATSPPEHNSADCEASSGHYLLRDGPTGRLSLVGLSRCSANPYEWIKWEHSLREAVMLLSGHHSDDAMRLVSTHIAYRGKAVMRFNSKPIATRSERGDAVEIGVYGTRIFSRKVCGTGSMVFDYAVNSGMNVAYEEECMSAGSVIAGWYDEPHVLGRMGVVSYTTHHLPKELTPLRTDIETYVTVCGNAAWSRHECSVAKHKYKRALVQADPRVSSVAMGAKKEWRSGICATPRVWQRSSAKQARIRTSRMSTELSLTHRNGRQSAVLQDDDSLEAEAMGLIDDSVADPGKSDSWDSCTDSDGEYREEEAERKRSKIVMRMERKAEIAADRCAKIARREAAARERLRALESDDDSQSELDF